VPLSSSAKKMLVIFYGPETLCPSLSLQVSVQSTTTTPTTTPPPFALWASILVPTPPPGLPEPSPSTTQPDTSSLPSWLMVIIVLVGVLVLGCLTYCYRSYRRKQLKKRAAASLQEFGLKLETSRAVIHDKHELGSGSFAIVVNGTY
jgi:hypothetical protein